MIFTNENEAKYPQKLVMSPAIWLIHTARDREWERDQEREGLGTGK